MRQSLKNSFQGQKVIHSTQCMNKKFSHSKKLVHRATLLTFNIRSKRRLNKKQHPLNLKLAPTKVTTKTKNNHQKMINSPKKQLN